MTDKERKVQIDAVKREIDDLNKQIAEADDEGDEKRAGQLRERVRAAKKQFTLLHEQGDQQMSDESQTERDDVQESQDDESSESRDEAEGAAEGAGDPAGAPDGEPSSDEATDDE